MKMCQKRIYEKKFKYTYVHKVFFVTELERVKTMYLYWNERNACIR